MDDLKELAEKYVSLWDCAGGTHAKSVSEGMAANAAIKRKLAEAGIDPRWFSVACNKNLSPEDNYKVLLKHHRSLAFKDKELCLLYIKHLILSKSVQDSKKGAKQVIAKRIQDKDPMLVKYIEYRIRLKQARDILKSYLVNETPESLELRYGEFLKDIFDAKLREN